MSRFFVILLTATVSLFFNACQKEPDPREIQDPVYDCKVSSEYYYGNGNGVVTDSFTYQYNGDQLTRIDISDGSYLTYDYANNKPVKRNIFVGGTLEGYETYQYNSNGLLTVIQLYLSAQSPKPDYVYEFAYSGNNLTKFIIKYDTSLNGQGQYILEYENLYKYTGSNISQSIENYYSYYYPSLQYADTTIYTYDTKPNYFKKPTGNALISDYVFSDYDGISVAIVTSANNVISISDNSGNYPLGHVVTEKGYLKEFSFNGILLTSYKYLCK